MEAKVLIRQSGFFISAITTIALALLSIEFIFNYKLSFFPFSFIMILYLAGLYLRNRFWRKAWKGDSKILFRYSNMIIWVLGIALIAIFLYFGNGQTVIYPLSHYAFNPYLIIIALIWTVYSVFEIYMINQISALTKYRNANYLTLISIVLVDLSFMVTNYFVYILPISLFLLSVSTVISAIRLREIY